VAAVDETSVAGAGRGVGSGLERVVSAPIDWTAEAWSIFERGTAPDARPFEQLDAIDLLLEIGPRAVLEERRSFAMFDGKAWTFGPVTGEEEAAWRELERRLARL
jgi:hypothetical protein